MRLTEQTEKTETCIEEGMENVGLVIWYSVGDKLSGNHSM